MDWLKRLFGKKDSLPAQSSLPVGQPPPAPSASQPQPGQPGMQSGAPSRESRLAQLERIRNKIHKMAEQFASGAINRDQFEELYSHYENQIQAIEELLNEEADSEKWKNAFAEGQSLLIRRRNVARMVGFAIYDNSSGMPVKTMGQFGVDPALFVPMLASYQSATQEIFGAGLRSTQIEGGRWLCFIPGKLTTTLALFSTEPAGRQLKTLEELQNVFESANRTYLEQQPIDPDKLACPQEFFLRHAF